MKIEEKIGVSVGQLANGQFHIWCVNYPMIEGRGLSELEARTEFEIAFNKFVHGNGAIVERTK